MSLCKDEELDRSQISGTECSHAPRPLALHQRGQLVVISDQYKGRSLPEGPQADRQRDLRRLVYDAVIKRAMREEGVRYPETRGSNHWLQEGGREGLIAALIGGQSPAHPAPPTLPRYSASRPCTVVIPRPTKERVWQWRAGCTREGVPRRRKSTPA